MKKLLYILFTVCFLTACSSDNENLPKDNNITYPKSDSILGYRFGSSIEEVNPDVVRSKDMAFSYSDEENRPATVFYFRDNKLTTLNSYYPSRLEWFNGNSFLRDIQLLEPSVNIELTNYVLHPEDYTENMNVDVIYLKEDSLSWVNKELNILIRNDFFSFDKKNIESRDYYLVIEYKKK